MSEYYRSGDSIEGKEILCVFEHRPSYGVEKNTGRQQVSIRGNPAIAIINKVWKYRHIAEYGDCFQASLPRIQEE